MSGSQIVLHERDNGAQNRKDEVIRKQNYLKEKLNRKNITFRYHYSDESMMEAVFARGDEKLSDVIECAFKKGCKFDSWGEYYDHNKWMEAFEECSISFSFERISCSSFLFCFLIDCKVFEALSSIVFSSIIQL